MMPVARFFSAVSVPSILLVFVRCADRGPVVFDSRSGDVNPHSVSDLVRSFDAPDAWTCGLADPDALLGTYGGNWQGSGGCGGTSFSAAGEIRLQLSAVVELTFKIHGTVRAIDPTGKTTEAGFTGTMECTHLDGYINPFVMPGLADPVTGTIAANYDRFFDGFPDGTFFLSSPSTPCKFSATWQGIRQ